jgi:uncharacterized membrane protein YgcG
MSMIRLFFWAVFFMAPLGAGADMPQSAGWVNDFANVISPEDRAKMTQIISELEVKTSAEIAVVTQKSVAPDDEFTYAQKMFDEWKIGKDNGVLILLAVEERAWRIHTGYGVEGALPDAACDNIGRNHMVPYFKSGDYSKGLYYGLVEVATKIALDAGVALSSLEGVAVPAAPRAQQHMPLLFTLVLFGFFLIWNIPWPIFIGLPFTLVFATSIGAGAPLAGIAIMAGWACSHDRTRHVLEPSSCG